MSNKPDDKQSTEDLGSGKIRAGELKKKPDEIPVFRSLAAAGSQEILMLEKLEAPELNAADLVKVCIDRINQKLAQFPENPQSAKETGDKTYLELMLFSLNNEHIKSEEQTKNAKEYMDYMDRLDVIENENKATGKTKEQLQAEEDEEYAEAFKREDQDDGGEYSEALMSEIEGIENVSSAVAAVKATIVPPPPPRSVDNTTKESLLLIKEAKDAYLEHAPEPVDPIPSVVAPVAVPPPPPPRAAPMADKVPEAVMPNVAIKPDAAVQPVQPEIGLLEQIWNFIKSILSLFFTIKPKDSAEMGVIDKVIQGVDHFFEADKPEPKAGDKPSIDPSKSFLSSGGHKAIGVKDSEDLSDKSKRKNKPKG